MGFPVTTPGTLWPLNMLYVSIIQPITSPLVFTSEQVCPDRGPYNRQYPGGISPGKTNQLIPGQLGRVHLDSAPWPRRRGYWDYAHLNDIQGLPKPLPRPNRVPMETIPLIRSSCAVVLYPVASLNTFYLTICPSLTGMDTIISRSG